MKLSKKCTSGIIFLFFMFSYAWLQASQSSDVNYPLSSLMVDVDINASPGSSGQENTLISSYFSLDADSDGIFPVYEDVKIGLSPVDSTGDRKQCLVIYIPAYSFQRINNWYVIDDLRNPADIGIKVSVVDESTGEFIKDLTDNLTIFYSILTPTKEHNQYYLFIDVLFENEYHDAMSFVSFIGSSPTSVLLVGDDSGSTLAQSVQF